MKSTENFCYASNNGKYLSQGNCFANELHKVFEECSKDEYFNSDEWFLLLSKQLTSKEEWQKQDTLQSIFTKSLSLDYDFVDKLNLFDVIAIDCFDAIGKLGEAIFELCIYAELRFIVSKKYYINKDNIKVNFEVCHCDSEYECHKALITQTIKD